MKIREKNDIIERDLCGRGENVCEKDKELRKDQPFAEYNGREGRLSSDRQRGGEYRYMGYRLRETAFGRTHQRVYARAGEREHSARKK